MLRSKGESIMIGDEVKITIVDVQGDEVILDITAPKGIAVLSKEDYDLIQIQLFEAVVSFFGD